MKNKRAVFTITKLLIGLALFSLFVVVLGGIYTNMTSIYDVPISDKYTKNYNKLETITNKTTAIGEQYQKGNLEDTNTLIIGAKQVYSASQIMINSISLPIQIIRQTLSDSDLPILPIFVTTLIAILVIAVTYVIGSLFARWFF